MFEYTGDGCRVPKDVIRVRCNEGVQKIGASAFSKCALLESIILPSTLVEIFDYAFYGCSSLREVTLNNGLQKIGTSAFYGCKSLQNINYHQL